MLRILELDIFKSTFCMKVALQIASKSNPELPPSSLPSFLGANVILSGGILAEFDDSYTNAAYATPHDNLGGINYKGIAAIAELLAQALHNLASSNQRSFEVDYHTVALGCGKNCDSFDFDLHLSQGPAEKEASYWEYWKFCGQPEAKSMCPHNYAFIEQYYSCNF